jgi:hypothetical protein
MLKLSPAGILMKRRFSLRPALFSVLGPSSAPVAALALGSARSPATTRLSSSLTTEYCEQFWGRPTHRSNCTENDLLNGYLLDKPSAASSEAASIAANPGTRTAQRTGSAASSEAASIAASHRSATNTGSATTPPLLRKRPPLRPLLPLPHTCLLHVCSAASSEAASIAAFHAG